MKDHNSRVKRLEQRMGTAQERNYVFLRLGYRPLEDYFKKGKACFRKGNFAGSVKILEKSGNEYTRSIDLGSQEGIEILENHGYAAITALDLDERFKEFRERKYASRNHGRIE